MSEKIFIAWGGNEQLALKVAEVLKDHGYMALIGGHERNNHYLAGHIFTQIQESTRFIILAQWPPEGMPTPVIKEKVEFRPNLMFEWGCLLAKKKAPYVYTYLIGIERSQLPADLMGAFCEQIELSDDLDKMAQEIVDRFLKDIRIITIKPCEIFLNWYSWRDFLSTISKGEEHYDGHIIASVITHCIQPAYYYNDVQTLCTLIRGINNPENDILLEEAKRIASSICKYYEETENQLKPPSLKEIKSIIFTLELPCDTSDGINPWLDAIRADYLGVALLCASDLKEANMQKDVYLHRASDSFNQALTIVCQIEDDKGYCDLWKGYILRNVGVVKSKLGLKNDGLQAYQKALEFRKKAYGSFLAKNTPAIILSHLQLEISLVRAEMINSGYINDDDELDEFWNEVKNYSNTYDLWKLVRKEIEQIYKNRKMG